MAFTIWLRQGVNTKHMPHSLSLPLVCCPSPIPTSGPLPTGPHHLPLLLLLPPPLPLGLPCCSSPSWAASSPCGPSAPELAAALSHPSPGDGSEVLEATECTPWLCRREGEEVLAALLLLAESGRVALEASSGLLLAGGEVGPEALSSSDTSSDRGAHVRGRGMLCTGIGGGRPPGEAASSSALVAIPCPGCRLSASASAHTEVRT